MSVSVSDSQQAFREKEAEVSPADESSPKARDIEAALSAEDLRLFASVARKVESLRQQERQWPASQRKAAIWDSR